MDWGAIFTLAVKELISPITATYVLCAIGLSVHFGYTGLLNFGQAAFAAIGGYGLAIAILTLHWPLIPAALFGLACSAVFAVVLGIPTLRLRADYLAIVTIAAAEIFRYFMTTIGFAKVTGGSNGLSQFGQEFWKMNPFPDLDYGFGPFTYRNDQIFVMMLGWTLVAICAILVWLLMRSPWGRVLRGIREDEDAVRSLGKNVFVYKLQALIFGGLFASLGGMLFVLNLSNVQPQSWGTTFTFMIWTVLLLGGAATVLGPIVGTLVFFFLMSITQGILSGLVSIGALPFLSDPQVGQIRFILIGLSLMLLVIFRPQGIFGNKREMQFNV
ncbi:branched-chain amino acid ABC transporter permease [Rhodoluna sp.]|uniref:branched-chain amino acid ABC transporter permease n=1 Tax=Rhodoluna sp. TaxID=1969481 RepID=UPI0025E9346D|nr:branched-chain amino acid ABC transporter permease [Rhodoluna sp.]